MHTDLSFVIPCYCSEHTIGDVVQKIVSTVADKNSYEIILVNDGSSDGTYKVLKSLAQENSNIKAVNLSKNFGQQNALMAGYNLAGGKIVISLDDDGQQNPQDCYALINALNDDVDVVYAKYPKKKHSPFRNFGTKMSKWMKEWLCEWPKDLSSTSYWACKKFVTDEICNYKNPYPFISGLVIQCTKKIINIEIEHHERKYGKSGYTFKKLINLWLNGFSQFSVKPLRIATFCGMFFSLVGFAYAIFIVIKKLLNPALPAGYSSIMCVLLILGGVLMIILGLIGEYIGRIYICINRTPQYVIKNTVNANLGEETDKNE